MRAGGPPPKHQVAGQPLNPMSDATALPKGELKMYGKVVDIDDALVQRAAFTCWDKGDATGFETQAQVVAQAVRLHGMSLGEVKPGTECTEAQDYFDTRAQQFAEQAKQAPKQNAPKPKDTMSPLALRMALRRRGFDPNKR